MTSTQTDQTKGIESPLARLSEERIAERFAGYRGLDA